MTAHRIATRLVPGAAATRGTILTASGQGRAGTPAIERKTCTAPDGVRIVYSVAGSGEPALLFVHGGLAVRQFWDGELKAFAASGPTSSTVTWRTWCRPS
jgi:hypothetical protein